MSHFSPKQAARVLGVSESSIKRWCDIGAVPAHRTAGGHRRIPRKCLEDLLAQAGDATNVLKLLPDVSEADARDAGDAPVAGGQSESANLNVDGRVAYPSDLQETRTEFCDALRLGLESRCRQILGEIIESGFTRSGAADWLMTHAMHQFGHLWEQGDLAVYQERRACGICLGLIHELKRSLPVRNDGPVAIGGSVRGDIYQLPTQLIELSLCEAGWRATSLGCNLPVVSFRQAVAEYKPRLLWISFSSIEREADLITEFNQLAESLSPETALVIGGRAASDTIRPKLHYTAHCDSLAHFNELAATLMTRG